MLKALLKKQFASLISALGGGKKHGARFYVLLIVGMALVMGVMSFYILDMLCKPLIAADLGWLFFVYVSIMSMAVSVVFGIFMAQTQLYEAKDNEFLLALPVPPAYILLTRMISLYAQHLFFSTVIYVSAFIVYGMAAAVTAVQVILWLVMMFVLPIFSLFITCLLGFLLALITSRLRDKTLVTVILSMVFIIGYVIVYSQIMTYIQKLIASSAAIGSGIKNGFYPLYALGTAFTGSGVGFAVSFAIIAGLFAALYIALAKTYVSLVTSKRASSHAKYKGVPAKPRSQFVALLKKEAKHFTSSGVYMLNSGLGVVMLAVLTVFFMVKYSSVIELIAPISGDSLTFVMLIVVAVVAFIAAMDMVTAPSISLEGKSLWIIRTSPVGMWTALEAKLAMHYLVTAPMATVVMIPFAIILNASWSMTILMLLFPSAVVLFTGVLGLIFNLKKPNLDWDNETFVVKQSMSVLLTMLSSWGVFIAMIGLYFAMRYVVSDTVYLFICLAVLSAITAGLTVYLKRRGTKIFESL